MPDIIDLEVSRRKVLIGGAGGAAMGALPAEAQTTPEGVARATTTTVVVSSLAVLASDFLMTALMFGGL